MRYKSDFTTSVSSNKELNFNLHNRARQIISPPSAKPADLLTVHEAGYLAELERKNSKESYDELLAEAGCVLSVVGQIHSNKCSNGLCLVPPGVSNSPSHGLGLNNVSICVQRLLFHQFKKVLVIDLHPTHASGTQKIFERDPNVLVCSIHESSTPADKPSATTECGIGSGKGFTVNVPIPSQEYSNEGTIVNALEEIVFPIGQEFKPEIIVITNPPAEPRVLASLLLLTNGRAVVITARNGIEDKILFAMLSFEESEISSPFRGSSFTRVLSPLSSPKTKAVTLKLLDKVNPSRRIMPLKRMLSPSSHRRKSSKDQQPEALRVGWLSKRGHFRSSWKRRYVVLSAGQISYHVDEHEVKAKGKVLLYGAVVDTLEGKPALKQLAGGKKASLLVYIVGRAGQKDFIFQAETSNEASAWCNDIRNEITECNDRKIRSTFSVNTTFPTSGFEKEEWMKKFIKELSVNWECLQIGVKLGEEVLESISTAEQTIISVDTPPLRKMTFAPVLVGEKRLSEKLKSTSKSGLLQLFAVSVVLVAFFAILIKWTT